MPQKVDQEYDGVQQLKKPLNFENATDKNDFKDVFNPDKKPNPGAYNQKKAVEKPVVTAPVVVTTSVVAVTPPDKMKAPRANIPEQLTATKPVVVQTPVVVAPKADAAKAPAAAVALPDPSVAAPAPVVTA